MIAEIGQLRVLIADDESATRMMSRALFERRGHIVGEAADGAEAIKAAARAVVPFDVVLLDLNMPVCDGLQALGAIRAEPDPARAGAAIIMLTAISDPAVEQRLLDEGADAVLTKPLRWDALAPVLAAVVTQAAGASPRKTEHSSRCEVKVKADPAPAPDGSARVLEIMLKHQPMVRGPAAANGPSPIERMLADLPFDKVKRLLEIASVNIAKYQTDLRAAAQSGDGAEVGRLAHKIVGVAGAYGCDVLRVQALALEHAAEGLDHAALQAAAAALDPAFADGLAFLRQVAG
jgi:two-component system, sensor histidine kinase